MGKDGRSGASNLSIPPRIAMQSSDFSYVPLPVSYPLHPRPAQPTLTYGLPVIGPCNYRPELQWVLSYQYLRNTTPPPCGGAPYFTPLVCVEAMYLTFKDLP